MRMRFLRLRSHHMNSQVDYLTLDCLYQTLQSKRSNTLYTQGCESHKFESLIRVYIQKMQTLFVERDSIKMKLYMYRAFDTKNIILNTSIWDLSQYTLDVLCTATTGTNDRLHAGIDAATWFDR